MYLEFLLMMTYESYKIWQYTWRHHGVFSFSSFSFIRRSVIITLVVEGDIDIKETKKKEEKKNEEK